MHVKIASSILQSIKSRELDKLQDIEDEIMSSRKVTGENMGDLERILEKATDQSNNISFQDKVRVLLIMILCLENLE